MSNLAQLLAALQAGRTVTRATALVTFKIANLTAEIATLRARGHRIVSITGDDGTGTKYTKYEYQGRRTSTARVAKNRTAKPAAKKP